MLGFYKKNELFYAQIISKISFYFLYQYLFKHSVSHDDFFIVENDYK